MLQEIAPHSNHQEIQNALKSMERVTFNAVNDVFSYKVRLSCCSMQ
jgi:hypothetical protein